MKQYFISKGAVKEGPYSIEELSSMELRENYLIWKDGFDSWKNITEVEELKKEIIPTPPPTPKELQRRRLKKKILNSFIISSICLVLLWFLIYIFIVGDLKDYELEEHYGYNSDFGIYGNGNIIREKLLFVALLISGIISALVFLISYNIKSNSTSEIS